MTKAQKQQIGGRLARIMRLRIDPHTRRYIVSYREDGRGPENSFVTAEQLYDIAHGVVCQMEYRSAIRDAVKALEGLLPKEGE